LKNNNPITMDRQEAIALIYALTDALRSNTKVQLICTSSGEIETIPLLNNEVCTEGIFMDL